MLKVSPQQLSMYSVLYDKIPNTHILKRISSSVDFSFMNPLLEGSYCKHFGRPAKEPEMMAKLLILQYLYNLSDVRIIDESRLNLAYMWFLGINPEEGLPEASLLTKFRKHRLKETSVDDIIQEVVRQCIERGIIKGTGLNIDATHCMANTVKKVPEKIMKHLAKKIFKSIEEEAGEIPDEINTNIPDYKASEQWFCNMGNCSVKKVYQRLAKKLVIAIILIKSYVGAVPNSSNVQEIERRRKYFTLGKTAKNTMNTVSWQRRKNLSKSTKSASHEWKNGEMKRFHGLDRARGYGLKSMSMQAKLTALVVNLKRIAALVSSNLDAFHDLITDYSTIPPQDFTLGQQIPSPTSLKSYT